MKKKKDPRIIALVLITIADVIYQLVPVDVIPDVIPVAGQVDDSIAVLINVLTAVRLTMSKHKELNSSTQ